MPKPFRLTAPVPKEYAVHVRVANLLRGYAKPDVCFFHVPNQQIGGARRGYFLKQMGRQAGASDLVIIHLGAIYFVEIKRPDEDRRASQEAFQRWAELAGAACFVVDSEDAAAQLFNDLGILRRRMTVATNHRLYSGGILTRDLTVTA